MPLVTLSGGFILKSAKTCGCAVSWLALSCVLAVTGCTLDRKKETTYVPGTGKVTIEEKGKDGEAKTTIKSAQGEMTLTNKATPADFDVPFYPGAEPEDSAAASMNAVSGQGGVNKWSAVVLKTKDSFDQVVKFYKEKMSDAQSWEASTGEDKTATIFRNKGDHAPVTTVRITRNKSENQTRIHILRASDK